jgi:peroxin-3
MLDSVSNYFYERRGGFARLTSYSGALYLAGTYAKDRLEEVKDRVLQERKARDK